MGLCQDKATIWPVQEQDRAQAVCEAESSGNPNALGDNGTSYGLWQIHLPAHPAFAGWDLFDPDQNARAALQVWQSQGWHGWSTFNNGASDAFLQGGPVAAVQSALQEAAAAVGLQDGSSIGPWLIGGVAAVLVLFGRR
jgi:hypothetical protein